MTADLRHPISLRGIDYWLGRMADRLVAHADQPIEIRDVAYSLRSKVSAIRRDPEYASTDRITVLEALAGEMLAGYHPSGDGQWTGAWAPQTVIDGWTRTLAGGQ